MQLTSKEVSLLRALYFLEDPTRSEIAGYTGLSAVSVTAVLNRLTEAGIARRASKTATGRGRPSATYQLAPVVGFTAGVYIGATSIQLVAVDTSHRIVARRTCALATSSTPEGHASDIVHQVTAELKQLLSVEELAGRRLLALGISPLGMVDTDRGVWLHGLQVSGVTHFDLRDAFARGFGVPVVVEDPSRCVAWLQWAQGKAAEPLVLLYLGEGVGAGIVMKGGLYRGHNGLAGEIGHMQVAGESERCYCGNTGCLEMVASVPGILRRFRRRLEEGVLSSLQKVGELDLARVMEAAHADDRLARSTMYDLGLIIGEACGTLVSLYNPRTLLIGGAGGTAGELFRDPVELRLRQRLIPEMLAGLSVDFASHTPEDEALGAAMIAEQNYWQTLDLPAARRLVPLARDGRK